MSKRIALLGSTGSIGVNTLNICRRFGIKVEALAVNGGNITLLKKQIEEFQPKFVAISNPEAAKEIDHPALFIGDSAVTDMLDEISSELIVNSMVGYAGLIPTLKAQKLGKKIALANKESLVVAGSFIDTSSITPIDSEHFGLWYLLNDKTPKRLIITASGGAFRDWDIKDIYSAKYEDALKHPNWSMGDKITIDSASMVNKLFEVLEAKWLFGSDNIEAYIERKSIIHALIEFKDGSTTAHIAGVDMKLPIAFAILDRVEEEILPNIEPTSIQNISFEEIDIDRYPLWRLKSEILASPKSGVVLNSANEAAMEIFRRGDCTFGQMCNMILDSYEKFRDNIPQSVDDIFEIDSKVRAYVG